MYHFGSVQGGEDEYQDDEQDCQGREQGIGQAILSAAEMLVHGMMDPVNVMHGFDTRAHDDAWFPLVQAQSETSVV
jgi:hypothetical protein